MAGSNYHDDESALGALGSTSSTQLMNRGNTEAPSYIVLEVKEGITELSEGEQGLCNVQLRREAS